MDKILLVKISLIMSFLSLTLVILCFLTSNSTSYEPSIHNVFPLYFWAIIVLLYLIFILYLLFSDNVYIKIISTIGILFLTLCLTLLPITRDYFFYGGRDTMAHIGYLSGLIDSGYIESRYPIFNIFNYIFITILNIDVYDFSFYIVYIFRLIFIISMVLIVKMQTGKISLLMLSLCSIPIIGNLNFTPGSLSFFYFPFALYLSMGTILKKEMSDYRFTSLAIIIFIYLLLLHFMSALFLLFLYLGLFIYIKFFYGLQKSHTKLIGLGRLFTVIFLFWLINEIFVLNRLTELLQDLLPGSTPLENLVTSTSRLYLYDYIYYTIYNFLDYILVITLATGIIGYKLFRHRNAKEYAPWPIFLLLSFIIVILFFIYDSATSGNILPRYTVFLAMISIIIIVLYFIRNIKKYKIIFVVTLFLLLTPLSIATVYENPLGHTLNTQVTEGHASSYEWINDYTTDGTVNAISYDYRLLSLLGYDIEDIITISSDYYTYSDNITYIMLDDRTIETLNIIKEQVNLSDYYNTYSCLYSNGQSRIFQRDVNCL